MATYKQKPRVQHHVAGDSEELSGSEQGWVVFNSKRASNNQIEPPIERRLVNNVNNVSDDDWFLLSGNTSPVEEGIPTSNSEFASGSDYDSSEPHVMDETTLSIELLPESQENNPSMPSHDGTGNFSNTILSDTILSNGSSHGSTTSLVDSGLFTRRHHASDKDNEPMYSIDHQNQQSTTSLLSTVWTTFRRLTNNIIISDDIDSIHGDFSHFAFASPNHNTGLASIITGTGENHYTYDSCYPPFGNHLDLSELCPSLHNYTSSSSTFSAPSYNRRRNSITTSSNTARIFRTPVSSSTSLKSFTSRAGSDCGLESGRGVGRSTSLKSPLVL